MDLYRVKPVLQNLKKPFDLKVSVPGSKSITNRALMLAALSDGETHLDGALFSADSRSFIQCLKDLQFDVREDEDAHTVTVRGLGGRIPVREASLNVGSAGTCARFMTAMLGFTKGVWHLDASDQMRKRPMAALLGTLTQLGCRIEYGGEEGYFPFTLFSEGVTASEATVDIGESSQFLSALLMSCSMLDRDFAVHIAGEHGFAYVLMTVRMMKQFGIEVVQTDERTFVVKGRSRCRAQAYSIEPDVSGACYFYAMAALSGGQVLVRDVHAGSLQGDIEFLHVLEKMGCTARDTREGILLKGPGDGKLRGIDTDMHSFSDQALTLAAIAPFADGDVTIRGIGHIRRQESDRIRAIISNLGRMGISAADLGDGVVIHPGMPSPARIETFDDHRVAMAFAVTGMKAPGIVIENPMCCKKTFENYFDIMDRIAGEYS